MASKPDDNSDPHVKLFVTKPIDELNIGGTIFQVNYFNWDYLPENSKLFNVIFKRRQDGKVLLRDKVFGHPHYFDRDPVYFRAILRYLKTGRVILDQGMVAELLKEEADFYGLKDPKFEEMCQKHTTEMEIVEMKMEIAAMETQLKELIKNCDEQQREVKIEFAKMKHNLEHQMKEFNVHKNC